MFVNIFDLVIPIVIFYFIFLLEGCAVALI